MRDSIKKMLAIMLSVALVLTMIPMIPGVAAKAYAANGSAITLVDSTGNQIVIDATEGGDSTNHTGTGYAYDLATNTLTLNGFTGQQILANGDFNLHLKGTNTITLVDPAGEWDDAYGLKAEYSSGGKADVTITADDGGVLNVTGTGLTHGVMAWYAFTNFVNGTLNIDVSATISNGDVFGINGSMEFAENETKAGTLNVKVENKGESSARGIVNGSLEVRNRDNVTINMEAKSDEEATAIDGLLYVENASPIINAKATDLSGNVGDKHYAIERQMPIMTLTAGGKVTFEGMVQPYDGRTKWNEHTVVTTPADGAYYWMPYKPYPSATGQVLMANPDDTPVKKAVIEYSAEKTRTLQYKGEGKVSIPAGKVGKPYERVYLNGYIIGALNTSDTGSSCLQYEIIEGSLPEGLSLNRSLGDIYGTPTAKAEAGTITIKVTDARGTYSDKTDDQSVTFTIPYGAVIEADRFITVGDTSFEVRTDASGTGWSYEADDKSLTLNGYNGGSIISEADFNLHLKGTNTITLVDPAGEWDDAYGLKAEYSSGGKADVTITADDGGVLNVTGTGLTHGVMAWYAFTNFVNGTLNIDVSATISNGDVFGINGSMEFAENETKAGTLNVKVENKGESSARGIVNGSLEVRNRDNVTINMEAKSDEEATAIDGLLYVENASPIINAKATDLSGNVGDKHYAIERQMPIMTLTAGGKVTFEGMVQPYDGRTKWNEHTVVTTPADGAYYWMPYKPYPSATGQVLMANPDDTPVKKAVIEYSAEKTRTLQYKGEGKVSIPAGKVGKPYERVYLNGYIIGALNTSDTGSSCLQYEIIEGSLPEGLSLNRSLGDIYGTPTAKAEAGTITIKVTDARGTYSDKTDDQSVTFTIPYGAVVSQKPVTALTLDNDELILNQKETVIVKATVTPTDAPYPEVKATENNYLLRVDGVGEAVDGVSEIRLIGRDEAGVTKLIVTSLDTGLKKEIPVYVKELVPTASQEDEYITGLKSNAKYTIDGTEYTTDNAGRIAIDPTWRLQTLEIVRVNEEPKCNSDAQKLTIAAKPLKDSWVTLGEYDNVYDGTPKTPEVTVKDGETVLVKDTDYTVAYTNNVDAGTATVTVAGIGNYSGAVEKTFNIKGINIATSTITLSQNEYTYDGTQHKPGVTVKMGETLLVKGTDYDVYYGENINAGNGYVTIEGRGIYEGENSKAFIIKKVSIVGKTIVLDGDSFKYTGSEIEPGVTIEGMTEGTDFEVYYLNNINAGTATVRVEGRGNYKGAITETFTILKRKLDDISGLAIGNVPETGKIEFSWNAVAGATEYLVERSVGNDDNYVELITTEETYIIDNNTIAGTTYFYRVKAVNSGGESAWGYEYQTCDLATPVITIGNVAETGKVKLSWKPIVGATSYEIYRSAGNDSNYVRYTSTTGTSYVNDSTIAGITYYYKVRAIYGERPVSNSAWGYEYQTCDLPAPVITIGNVESTGKIKLSWKAIDGATSYEIYRSDGNDDNYVKYTTTSNDTYTDNNTKAGTTYYYRVRALYSSKPAANSAWGYEYQTCDLAAPVITISNVAETGKVKLSWKPIDGATSYEIYRSAGNDSNYVRYTSTTGTTYVNESTLAGITYYYKVRAIYGDKPVSNSAWGYEYQTCDLAKPKITVTGTKYPGKVYVSWNKVDRADKYIIYRSTSENGTYVQYSTTTGTTYTNTSVTKGSRYYYKIIAVYDGKPAANSAYSNIDYATVR